MVSEGKPGWLLRHIGNTFVLLVYADHQPIAADLIQELQDCRVRGLAVRLFVVAADAKLAAAVGTQARVLIDCKGRFKERYDAVHGTAYLVRPDQHVAARWRTASRERLVAALARATCNSTTRNASCH